MKVLIINKFLFPKGGDAISALGTGALLLKNGHEVLYWGMQHPENPVYPDKEFFVGYREFSGQKGILENIRLAAGVVYSKEAKNKVEKFINIIRPDVVHLNNFAHQISPSILDVFEKQKIPCVMTMHDYKLVCAAYLMLNHGKICEDCRGGAYYRCFINRCVKESVWKSVLSSAEMYCHHRLLKIYKKIKWFIAPSYFMVRKMIEMGFRENCEHLPNFIDVQRIKPEFKNVKKAITYVGRLSKEKGLLTLLNALDKNDSYKVNIIGEGPQRRELEKHAKTRSLQNVLFHGYMKGPALEKIVKSSTAIILPSICYENNPMSILEAFAFGKPAIGSRIGGIPEIIKDEFSGLTFEAGNSADLRQKIIHLMENNTFAREMGINARHQVEQENSPESYYSKLLTIYQKAILLN